MADFSELDDDARKAEASRRLAKLLGWDTEEAKEALDPRVRFSDETGKQILKFILQDTGTPEPLPQPPPQPLIATLSQLKELIRELELTKPLAWLSRDWWRSLFASYGAARFCRYGCRELEEYWRHQNYQVKVGRLRLGAWHGCEFCSVLQHAVLLSVPKEAQSLDGWMKCVNGEWSYELAKGLKSFSIEFFGLRDNQPLDSIKFTLPGLRPASLIPGDTSSDQSFAIVQNWLEQCVNNHEQCGQAFEAPLPKRILDVSKTDVFLYESRNEPAKYICLSHCWGVSRPKSMTTLAKLSSYKRFIPWGDFSQNFKDAIHFCRRLQISYIWIDCLCIVQDDELDWREQSAEMYSIYSNAFMTLAATSSENSDGGCYSQARSQYLAKEISPYGVFLRTPLPHFTRSAAGRVPERFPLLNRAWVCQERRLSNRMLHFTSNELVWECKEGMTCECSAHAEEIGQAYLSRIYDFTDYDSWHGICTQYSTLALTFKRDKLPALSGLARGTWQTRPGDKYLAGVWEKTLLDDMLWEAWESVTDRPQQWRAPTWSWASVDSFIGYGLDTPFEGIKILQTNCTPVNDPFGEVVSASLKLKTVLFTGCLRYEPQKDRFGGERYTVYVDGFESRPIDQDYNLSKPGQYHVEPDSEIFFMIAGHVVGSRGSREFHGLILRRVGQMEDFDAYERIGKMKFFEWPSEVDKKIEQSEAQTIFLL